jgi:dienelactone hydrolase
MHLGGALPSGIGLFAAAVAPSFGHAEASDTKGGTPHVAPKQKTAKKTAKEPLKRVYSPMQHMLETYEAHPPALAFSARTEADWKTWRGKLKRKFMDLLGGLEDPRCDLAPQVSKRKKLVGYTREHVLFQTRPNLTVAAWVLVPEGASGKLPTMICLHGHGAGKDEIVGINDDGAGRAEYGGYQKDFAVQAVRRGFLAIAPDMLSFGERRDAAEIAQGKGSSSCRRASLAGMLLGRTMPGLRVHDVMRCIDYLETRPECDPKRIGCMGISGGGQITTFAAAVEERISAALISGYLAQWRDSVVSILHCEDNYVPNVLQWGEMSDIASLIAPRPVFFENGTADTIFPIKSARAAFKQIKEAYKVAGWPHRCDMQVFTGEHQFCGEKGFPFLERWLKG